MFKINCNIISNSGLVYNKTVYINSKKEKNAIARLYNAYNVVDYKIIDKDVYFNEPTLTREEWFKSPYIDIGFRKENYNCGKKKES